MGTNFETDQCLSVWNSLVTMIHPFDSVPFRGRRTLLWVFGTSSLIIGLGAGIVGRFLYTAAAPLGIISFELAGSPLIFRSVLQNWGPQGQILAGFVLGLNFLLVFSYSTFVAVGCLWAAERIRLRGRHAGNAGKVLAWGQWVATLAGFGADSFLIAALYAGKEQLLPVARILAEIKFTLVLAGAIYVLLGIYFAIMGQLAPRALNRAVKAYGAGRG